MATVSNEILTASYLRLKATQQHELRNQWLHAVSKDTHAIGWLPVKAFDTRAENGDLSAVYRNGDLVGWAMHVPSRSRGIVHIYQIWVRPDARIITHGKALIGDVIRKARSARCHALECWVGEDLEANIFWAAIGFVRHNWRWGKGDHPRRLYRWTMRVMTCENSLCHTL